MANLALMQKLKKASVIKHSSCLDDSVIFNKKDVIPTLIPAINIALSGTLDGGLTSGLTMWAGPSKHFKSMFSLLMAKAYMDKYPDAVMMFYDSEFGTPIDYFKSLGIDTSRVMHTPLMNIEEMKFDVQNVLESVDRGDKVIFVIDSVGNIASKKEVEDAINQKSVGDMTRAKQLKSFFRMVTPQLTVKDIPMVVINHTYETQEMFSKTVVAGGTGGIYSADNIYIIGKQQDKDGSELMGWNFVINVDKSRFCKEKSKIFINVRHDKGMNRWSGLLDIALETGHVQKPSNGWYSRVIDGVAEDKKYRKVETDSKAFWSTILADPTFKQAVTDKFKVSNGNLIHEEAEPLEAEEFEDED
ncbi:MAG: hypothetical protein RSC93_02235 [Erysipelotrichaceae bacterium]